jgi:hypothetical protein
MMSDEYWIRIVPGQWRWRWDLNPRKGCPFTRFRVLRTTVHRRPSAYLTCTEGRCAFTDERLRTGVNETKTEPTASRRTRHGELRGASPMMLRPEQGALGYARPVHKRLRRSATAGRLRRPRLNAADGRPPLPFRSQNRTQHRCAACGPGGWRSGATPTRFPTMRTSVRASPGQSVTWDDRNRRGSADARELGRMRLRMRLADFGSAAFAHDCDRTGWAVPRQ